MIMSIIEMESMFSYIDRARESGGGMKEESIISPSGLKARYVGIAGYVAGSSNRRALVNLLSTAPGKRTLFYCQNISQVHQYMVLPC